MTIITIDELVTFKFAMVLNERKIQKYGGLESLKKGRKK